MSEKFLVELIEAKMDNAIAKFEYSEYWIFRSRKNEVNCCGS